MKGLSSLERIILEGIGKGVLVYEEIQKQTGLNENVCYNILQALIIRGLVKTDGIKYRISESLSPLIIEEINGKEAKEAEYLELMEAVVEQQEERVFRLQKIAMDSRDEKIFVAMLSNLESFLADAHKKAHASVSVKDRKVVFWGMGNVDKIITQIVTGK
jgi:DNA-binding IclR family transcriptional regulator